MNSKHMTDYQILKLITTRRRLYARAIKARREKKAGFEERAKDFEVQALAIKAHLIRHGIALHDSRSGNARGVIWETTWTRLTIPAVVPAPTPTVNPAPTTEGASL